MPRPRRGASVDWSTQSDRARTARLDSLLRSLADLRPDAPELAVQKLGDSIAAVYGWLVHHNPDSRRVQPGLPDSIYLNAATRKILFVEYKARTGDLRPDQARWITALSAIAPGNVIALIIRPANATELVGILRHSGAWAPVRPPRQVPLIAAER